MIKQSKLPTNSRDITMDLLCEVAGVEMMDTKRYFTKEHRNTVSMGKFVTAVELALAVNASTIAKLEERLTASANEVSKQAAAVSVLSAKNSDLRVNGIESRLQVHTDADESTRRLIIDD